MGKFEGITEYHDGIAVSEYMNMLPMGATCLDRVGERYMFGPLGAEDKLRGTFMDSHGNIYVVVGTYLLRSKLDEFGNRQDYERMEYLPEGSDTSQAVKLLGTGRATFCESSVKPSVVYCCDGTYIYMWFTTPADYAIGERAPYMVNAQYLPNIDPIDSINPQPDMMKFILDSGNTTVFDVKEDAAYAASICWFDNKLVFRQKDNNTVWLSSTDPTRFFRDKSQSVINQSSGFNLWNSWYSSTNSSDTLVDIASFKGQLFLINTHSIEGWSRTGNEDSPIQSNTTQVIHFGGRSPLIVEDSLYLICRDSTGHEFIGMLSDQFHRISNAEVDRRMDYPLDLQCISQRHENHLYVRCGDSNGFIYRDGRWSSWKSPKDECNPVVCSVYEDIGVTLHGDLVEFDSALRTTANGYKIERYIRDGFEQFPRRVIFRRVEVVMDTGRTCVPSPDKREKAIYIAMSMNRGLSFGQRHYRNLGKSGENDKVIEWRNLGSGNSVLLEIGTSGPYALQLYDLKIEAE